MKREFSEWPCSLARTVEVFGEPVEHQDVQFCVGPGYPDDVCPELDMRGRLAPAPSPDPERRAG